jgi:integrase
MRLVRSMLKVARRQQRLPIGLRELFLNADMLASAACDAARIDGRGSEQLTFATLQSRRIAARSFMRLMEDQLGRDADTSIAAFEASLRAGCRRVGVTYRPHAGRPTGRKTFTPTLRDIEALLHYVGASPQSYFGKRNVAFVHLLACTGLRLSSAVAIDGADFYRLGSSLWLSVREKCRREVSQVRIPPEVEGALARYVEAFNREMAERGVTVRIGLGIPGAFWRCPPARPWTRQGAAVMIRSASRRVCSKPFGPHAIRRFVAQQLARRMSRADVADVLRWDGVATLDKHYGPPPGNSRPPELPAALVPEGGGDSATVSSEKTSTRRSGQLVAGRGVPGPPTVLR